MPSLADAVSGVDVVQENGPELVDTKRAIFAELDRLCPEHAILASSTSAIVASRFTEELPGTRPLPGRASGQSSSSRAARRALRRPLDGAGDHRAGTPDLREHRAGSDHVNREVEGFVLNRLQGALLAEAFRLVGEGVVSPQDLDKTLKDGLGLRWSFIGPFETIELNAPGGIADYCKRYTGFYRSLSADPAKPDVWDEENVSRILDAWGAMPSADTLAHRSAWRDKRLAALKAHKQSQPEA